MNNSEILYGLTVQEVGRSQPDIMQISQEEYDELMRCNEEQIQYKIQVGNELRIYNLDLLSSIKIKKI